MICSAARNAAIRVSIAINQLASRAAILSGLLFEHCLGRQIEVAADIASHGAVAC
jgi:hypothetical protein